MVGMEYTAGLIDPLCDVRDVVESFRCCGVIPSDWRQVFHDAVAALERLPRKAGAHDLRADLLPQLQLLLSEGLPDTPLVVADVADRVAEALKESQPPGIPIPSDDDWSFGGATAS